ncbi:sel1 repeat family protein [Pseudohoeflea suaedae]|uniref:Sel1 repeat family protein n=1 Tax=Pseudohoeflea suaedae TaxID=877384 RepID=A0A4R5PJR9_9HYPH|nr:sel1 repeat family protein [Pseudohoeflea suaedae]TDH35825.1 sel1 repeat family protein [Pseudohoeflea suaedae]
MACYEIHDLDQAAMGGETRAEVYCEMGLMYAAGRDCEQDMVAAHKWLNIAAVKGSDRAADLRAELGRTMSKVDLALALRQAREWMTMH